MAQRLEKMMEPPLVDLSVSMWALMWVKMTALHLGDRMESMLVLKLVYSMVFL